jgi:hypothetical protein
MWHASKSMPSTNAHLFLLDKATLPQAINSSETVHTWEPRYFCRKITYKSYKMFKYNNKP